jgi:hypothetical protein
MKRGPKTLAENNKLVATILSNFCDSKLSRYQKLKLASRGLLVQVPVKSDTRGRPAIVYELSGKGRGFVALSKKWK